MTERTNCCKVSSDPHRHTKTCMHIHTSKQISQHIMSLKKKKDEQGAVRAWVDLLCKEK